MRRQLEALLEEPVEAAVRRERAAFDEAAAPFATRLVLFGAGGFGRRTLAGLRGLGIEPLAFTDNNRALWGGAVEGVPVLPPAKAAARFGESAAFVVTIWNGHAKDRMSGRVGQLRTMGCARVAPAGLLFWKYPEAFLPYYPLDLPHRVLLRADDVRRAFELWSDEDSRREYVAQVAFRLRLDYDGLGAPGPEPHYFPPQYRLTPEEVLVDCGAFDGDTLRAFLALRGESFAGVIAFEPDALNRARLLASLEELPEPVRRRIECLPYAVSAARGTLRFQATGTDLSSAGAGESTVECVALDEALAGTEPTLLKFDIEGGEPEALEGARRTIARRGPVLAVSAYHAQSHLWEISLQIDGIRKGYRYALRPHSAEAWDLVCYAIPPERWLG